MSPDFLDKWEKLIEDVPKEKIPMEFINKIIVKLKGRRQQTINISRMITRGFSPSEIEDSVTETLIELDDSVMGIEFILDVKSIADAVQPETDHLLRGL